MRPCPTVRILGGNKAWHYGRGLWCRVPFPYGRRCLFLLVAFATTSHYLHQSPASAPFHASRPKAVSRQPPDRIRERWGVPTPSAQTVVWHPTLRPSAPFSLSVLAGSRASSYPPFLPVCSFTTAVPLAKAIVLRRPKSLLQHTTTISKQSLFHVFHPEGGITTCFPSAEVRMISRRPNPYSLRKPPCRLPGSPTSEGQSPLQWQR